VAILENKGTENGPQVTGCGDGTNMKCLDQHEVSGPTALFFFCKMC
jgi:hypothetical protein